MNLRLGATTVAVRSGGRVVAATNGRSPAAPRLLVGDHDLEVLVGKPGALPNPTALAQAREQGAFTPTHEAFWRAARHRLGDTPGTGALTRGAAGHRHLPAAAVIEGMGRGRAAKTVNPEVVLVETRHAADADSAQVVPIGGQPLAHSDRPTPTLGSDAALVDRDQLKANQAAAHHRQHPAGGRVVAAAEVSA